MASTFIHGLMIENFRGIGTAQKVSPFKEINFLIGANNSGKSTMLRFLSHYLHDGTGRQSGASNWARIFDPLDLPINRHAHPKFAFAMPLAEFEEKISSSLSSVLVRRAAIEVVEYFADDGLVWLYPDANRHTFDPEKLAGSESVLTVEAWHKLWTQLTGRTGGGVRQHWIPESLAHLSGLIQLGFPSVRLVPAKRQIGAAGEEFKDYSGRGLIDRLAEYQNPRYDQREKRLKFDDINVFVRAVTGSDDATIGVPHDRKHLLVHMDGKVLPLDSLGTGIHEVILLASFCTLVNDEIICLEEPEIHLHPLLQRKLIRYLRDKTTNQYFIATHAPSLLDAVDAAIFHVKMVDSETRVQFSPRPSERHDICRQLGYLASDLLQSNAIIWVEGPSDRIYLRHWISAVAPELEEGIDYSIMFYGGRLLSHLTADDQEVTEFICLRRLNRNAAILIDSDKRSAQSRLNETKRRVINELGNNSWVTAGREIENYVPVSLIETALKSLYGQKFVRLCDSGRYEHRLNFVSDVRAEIVLADKIKIARLVCSKEAILSELDLKERVENLADFIRVVNRHR